MKRLLHQGEVARVGAVRHAEVAEDERRAVADAEGAAAHRRRHVRHAQQQRDAVASPVADGMSDEGVIALATGLMQMDEPHKALSCLQIGDITTKATVSKQGKAALDKLASSKKLLRISRYLVDEHGQRLVP